MFTFTTLGVDKSISGQLSRPFSAQSGGRIFKLKSVRGVSSTYMLRYTDGSNVPKLVPGTISDATIALFWPFNVVEVQLGVSGACQSVFTTYTPSIRQSSPGELSNHPRLITPPFQFCQTVALVTVMYEPHIFNESSPVRTNTLDACAVIPN